MYTAEEENLIILSSVKEIGADIRAQLINHMQDMQSFLIKRLAHGVYNILKDKLSDSDYRAGVFKALRGKGIVCVTYLSPLYPENLKNIDTPPAVLYCKGNCELLKSNCFSVVGSRKTTQSALALCSEISGELTHAFTVVTGMAEGADSSAVAGALPSGKIISVLANGFNYLYPACNRGLIEKVAQCGLLVSEYPPHIPPLKRNFPLRNRIIAGLSRGTLVVSAGGKSGALITANCALEYGRDVFAFPYSPNVVSGKGCNDLIKNGAYLTENILDICKVYGLDLEKSEKHVITEEEQAVLDQIAVTGEGFLPVIAHNLNKVAYQLIPLVASLEIKGKITRLGGNRYGII